MNSLIGIWMFTSLIYQGNPLPMPNPALKIFFTFKSNSVNEIFYYRENEHGYCKRNARYEIKGEELYQNVISVDENNADFCSQDVDMQLGHVSISQFKVIENKFYLLLPLGEETLTYVWNRTSQSIREK